MRRVLTPMVLGGWRGWVCDLYILCEELSALSVLDTLFRYESLEVGRILIVG
jgi:hypothetical protein